MSDQLSMTNLERRALLSAIEKVHSEALRESMRSEIKDLEVLSRQDNRPWGFYTHFKGPLIKKIEDEGRFNIKTISVWGLYKNKKNPISFSVYFVDGLIDYLEASSTVADWPDDERAIDFVDDDGNSILLVTRFAEGDGS